MSESVSVKLLGFPVNILHIVDLLYPHLEKYKKDLIEQNKPSNALLWHFYKHTNKRKNAILELVSDCLIHFTNIQNNTIEPFDIEWTLDTLTYLGFANIFETLVMFEQLKQTNQPKDLINFIILPYCNSEYSWQFKCVHKKYKPKGMSLKNKDYFVLFGLVTEYIFDEIFLDTKLIIVAKINQLQYIKPEQRCIDTEIENKEQALQSCISICKFLNYNRNSVQQYMFCI